MSPFTSEPLTLLCVVVISYVNFAYALVAPPPVPEILIVFVAPVPVAVTPAPTKFSVVAAVYKSLPSS